MSPIPRFQLVLDWDGTMTAADTTAVIGATCLAKARDLVSPNLPPEKQPRSMGYYSEQYMREYRDWKTSTHSSLGERKTIGDELEFLSQSKPVEHDSYLRVRDAVLSIPGRITELATNEQTRNEFMTAAGRQAVRDGAICVREPEMLRQLITEVEDGGGDWGIVSVSWSRRFIFGAMIEAGLIRAGQADARASKVRCNELLAPVPYDSNGSPAIICTAADKLKAYQDLLKDFSDEDRHQSLTGGPNLEQKALVTIYVGDSMTDIGCLEASTVGVYMNESKKEDTVTQTLGRLGIACRSIEELQTFVAPDEFEEVSGRTLSAKTVYSIASFREFFEWIREMR